jgi:hypothetical protein
VVVHLFPVSKLVFGFRVFEKSTSQHSQYVLKFQIYFAKRENWAKDAFADDPVRSASPRRTGNTKGPTSNNPAEPVGIATEYDQARLLVRTVVAVHSVPLFNAVFPILGPLHSNKSARKIQTYPISSNCRLPLINQTMHFTLHEVADEAEFPPIVAVEHESYSTPFNGFWEVLKGPSQEECAARQWSWHKLDPSSHWLYVTDDDAGGEVIAGLQWNIHEANPYANGPPVLPAYWWPEGKLVNKKDAPCQIRSRGLRLLG